jgi:hypothetical protein
MSKIVNATAFAHYCQAKSMCHSTQDKTCWAQLESCCIVLIDYEELRGVSLYTFLVPSQGNPLHNKGHYPPTIWSLYRRNCSR